MVLTTGYSLNLRNPLHSVHNSYSFRPSLAATPLILRHLHLASEL